MNSMNEQQLSDNSIKTAFVYKIKNDALSQA